MNEKTAQDFMEQIRRGVSQVPGMASQAGGAIKDWYQGLNPDMRNTLLRGLAGAGIGAGVTGGLASMTKHDPEEKHPVLGPALMGALLGGGAGAAIPYGLKLLSNEAQLPGERTQPVGSRLAEGVMTPLLTHPATTIGGALGTGALMRAFSKIKGEGGKMHDSPLREEWAKAKTDIPHAEYPKMNSTLLEDLRGLLPNLRKPKSDTARLIGEQDRRLSAENLKMRAARLANKTGVIPAKRIAQTFNKTPIGGGKLSMLAPPVGLAAGALIDKYLKGDY